jgi:hypothetical protein
MSPVIALRPGCARRHCDPSERVGDELQQLFFRDSPWKVGMTADIPARPAGSRSIRGCPTRPSRPSPRPRLDLFAEEPGEHRSAPCGPDWWHVAREIVEQLLARGHR